MVGWPPVHISKHSLFRLKITVGCRFCAYPNIRVCGVCAMWCVCALCVWCVMCGVMCRVVCCACVWCMCWVCVWDGAFCVLMMWCAELCRYVWYLLVCCCVLLCVVVCCCVLLCTEAFWTDTRRRFEPTDGEEVGEGVSCLSLVPSLSPLLFSFSLPSFSSFVLFLFLFFFSLLFTLKNNDSDHSSNRLSLYARLWLALQARLHGPWSIPCWQKHVRNMQETTVLVFPVQTSCHLEWSGPVSVLEMGVGCVSMWS